MKPRRPPGFEPRRGRELEAELLARARAWIPAWDLDGERQDFGRALLGIAARYGAEVAERLDRAGEKLGLGFLDWLAVRGAAARPARLPVVFRLTERARTPKPATAATRLQVEAAGVSVILETEMALLILPGGLRAAVATDSATDAFYLAPPGLSDMGPLEPLPTQWQLKSFAAAGATKVQLDPQLGLVPDMLVDIGGRQHRVVRADKDIVTIDPPLRQDAAAGAAVGKVTAFMPFDGAAHNRQEHALYFGHRELLDVTAAAAIVIAGAGRLPGVAWHYWGKRDPADATGWQELTPADAPDGGVLLYKPPGAMALLELAPGVASRWVRATLEAVPPDAVPLNVDRFDIRLNCAAADWQPCQADPALAPPAQGMANTTPLVLGNVFYPLGKEPRQFDAFYLGSQEAFSKKGATVKLQFAMAELNFRSLTALRRGPQAAPSVAGVPGDGQLHLFDFSPTEPMLARRANGGPLRPPLPAAPNLPPPRDNLSIALDDRPPFPLPVWSVGGDTAIAAPAAGAVWIWQESGAGRNPGGWMPAGVVDPSADPRQAIEGLAYLADDKSGVLVALRGGRLFVHDVQPSGGRWEALDVIWTNKGKDEAVALARIAPICRQDADPGNGVLKDGIVGVSAEGRLFAIELLQADGTRGASCTLLADKLDKINEPDKPDKSDKSDKSDRLDATVAPVAVRDGDNRLVAVAVRNSKPQRLEAFRSTPGTFELARTDGIELAPQPVIGGLIAMDFADGVPTVVVAAGAGAGMTAVVSWQPFAPDGMSRLLAVPIRAGLGEAAGVPTLLAGHVLVPTSANQVIVAPFHLGRHIGGPAKLSTAVITAGTVERLEAGDRLAVPDAGPGGTTEYRLRKVASPVLATSDMALHEFHVNATDAPLFVYRHGAPVRSTIFNPAAPATLALDAADPDPPDGSLLLVTTNASTRLYPVSGFDPGKRRVTLGRALEVAEPAPDTVTYVAPQRCHARVRPMLRIDAPPGGNLPGTLRLIFPGARPERQTGTVHALATGGSALVVLDALWQHKPPVEAGRVKFIVDRNGDGWSPQLGGTYTNPELSWEYWNGKGWWQLDETVDGTLSLQRSGIVKFDVPADIGPSDWAGQTNYWIRARLISGDYGREEVRVETTRDDDGKSTQVVKRVTDGIRPPSVARLCIGYRLCQGVQPDFVLVRDSGSLRDQSDANRTPGASVEAFVPLGRMLDRLSGAAHAMAGDCRASGCDGVAPPADDATHATPDEAPGRALYLGFDAPLLGEPVNLLLLVGERDHDAFAPLRVAVLIADRFVPVVASDATRALGESGVLSLALPVEATPRELFGQTLRWLRLAPAAGTPAQDWKPNVLGACLNGVWARAAETTNHELIGSSQGEPGLTLYVARPPVLRDTLALRVKEPLGDEEIAALQADHADRVLTALANFPGSWVLWRQVADPGDEAPDARVYALDEATGEIRFGDGRHGRIPPVGRDAIMAVTYRRAELGTPGGPLVPGNAIAARTVLNLVSPIDGVEAVHAADGAAGGAPAQSAGEVARFGGAALRHRERALTARDVEDLALAGFPDIAQARCFPRQGCIRLVVVMRGADPVPTAARRRELHRTLLPLASPLLGTNGALRIAGPTVRRLRVDLQLGVSSLDDAGTVARAARSAIAALFDTATGGVDGTGWPLGAAPAEADVAFALAHVPRLAGIASVSLRAVDNEGGERPWPAALGRAELPWLVPDGVRIVFEPVGVSA